MTQQAQAEALANLRHLYQQMVNGAVKDSTQAKRIAEGLLSRAIAQLEAQLATFPTELATFPTELATQKEVQLPEPAIQESKGVCCGSFTSGGYYMGQSEQVCCGCPVDAHPAYYTEQQVRAMLSTPPAQERKPLTDEQILDVLQLTNPKPSGLVVRLVRAIECAHGIQEPS